MSSQSWLVILIDDTRNHLRRHGGTFTYCSIEITTLMVVRSFPLRKARADVPSCLQCIARASRVTCVSGY